MRELAEANGVRLTKRMFIDTRDEKTRELRTTFIDVPRPRDELLEELEEMGVIAVQ